MSIETLKQARDAAFAAYLKIRKSGGTSRRKKAALVKATIAWHRAVSSVAVWQEKVAS